MSNQQFPTTITSSSITDSADSAKDRLEAALGAYGFNMRHFDELREFADEAADDLHRSTRERDDFFALTGAGGKQSKESVRPIDWNGLFGPAPHPGGIDHDADLGASSGWVEHHERRLEAAVRDATGRFEWATSARQQTEERLNQLVDVIGELMKTTK